MQVQTKITLEVDFLILGQIARDHGSSQAFIEEAQIEDIQIVQITTRHTPPTYSQDGSELTPRKRLTTHQQTSIFKDIDLKNKEVLKLLANIEKILEQDMAEALFDEEVRS